MNSTKCPACNLVQWSDAGSCKRCGAHLVSSSAFQERTTNPTGSARADYDPNAYGGFRSPNALAGKRMSSGLAIASMVIGIVAIPTSFLLIGFLMAPVALVLGIVALLLAWKKPTAYGGKGFAIAGVAVSSVTLFFILPIVLAIAIPNILAAKRSANESVAIATIEKIAFAQERHSISYSTGDCGDLPALAEKMLVDSDLAEGERFGYQFVSSGSSGNAPGCEVTAVPKSPSDGDRSFYYSSSDKVLRYARQGQTASHRSDPLASDPTSIRSRRGSQN